MLRKELSAYPGSVHAIYPLADCLSYETTTPKQTNPVLSDLIEISGIDGDNGEGCFLVAMCFIREYYSPGKLPPARQIWDGFRDQYDSILEQNILMVPHEVFGPAFDMYNQWGIRMSGYWYNNIGSQLISDSMRMHGPEQNPELSNSDHPLPLDGIPFPYCILLNLPGTSRTHVLAIDGSVLTGSLLKKFLRDRYRVVAVFTFEADNHSGKITGWEE